MKEWIVRIFHKYCNRETMLYVVFGIFTTVVDFGVYKLSMLWLEPRLGLDIGNLIANAIAWVAAVIFSYAVNKWLVFRRRAPSKRALLVEIGQFVGARVASFLISELGMFLLVTVANFNEMWSKVIVSVAVVIINYFFMKWVVFRSPGETRE